MFDLAIHAAAFGQCTLSNGVKQGGFDTERVGFAAGVA
jgi:hypothetical protein